MPIRVRVEYTKEFRDDLRKIRDGNLRNKIRKAIEKIIDSPGKGKPLKYELKGLRSVRVPPFRIIYKYNNDLIMLLKVEHRKKSYKKMAR
ncbi:MAG: Plasmid stabilization system protein [Candidatus Methanolliviera sp. GoM_oil]|nr:MAG: Plasmid stabilization system protein [Candidatus Methanolliviera sp. GoM_oil]